MSKIYKLLHLKQNKHFYISILTAIFLFVIIGFVYPRYILLNNLLIKTRTWLPLVMVACGQTIVVLGAGIDLSVGTMIAFVNVAVVYMIEILGGTVLGISFAFVFGIIVGLCAGGLNGYLIAYLRFQPIVTTFATSILWQGLALWIRPESGGDVPMLLNDIYSFRFLFLNITGILIILLILFIYYFNKTQYCVHLRAVGGNAKAAFETGLSVKSIRLKTYMFCGMFTALAAILIVCETITGNPLAGRGYDLESISATVLGGTRLAGSVGNLGGSIVGAFIIKLVNDAIFFLGIPVNFQKLMQGLILIFALLIGGIINIKRKG